MVVRGDSSEGTREGGERGGAPGQLHSAQGAGRLRKNGGWFSQTWTDKNELSLYQTEDLL